MRNGRRSSSAFFCAFAFACALLFAACSTSSTSHSASKLDSSKVPATMTVTSRAFANDARIPVAYTCDGPGTIPPLAWSAPPTTTTTIAIVVDDPDAPSGDFVHWIVVNLPASTRALAGALPSGAHELDNTGGTHGWTAPCPQPAKSVHHYRFTVYALNDYVCPDNGDQANTPDCDVPSSQEALPQIAADAIAKGALVGTYSR